MDISSLISSSGIDAKRTATELFGTAVEEFAGKPLAGILNGLNPAATAKTNRNDGNWYASSYAHSLVNSDLRPKMKFMFRVEFLFKPEILTVFAAETAAWKNKFTFLIQKVDRPKIDFEYKEVNLYNFRTKVLSTIKHRDLTMTFLDDVGNNVHEFFRFMMMVHSPITRRSVGASQEIADAKALFSTGSGMVFSEDLGNTSDFAQRGVMNTDIGNAIQAIKITQIFMTPTGSLDNAAKEVSFFFINPRIVSFDLDELDHSASEASTCSMAFDYDFMVMGSQTNLNVIPDGKGVPDLATAPGEPSPTGKSGSAAGGSTDPYTAILAGVGARAAQKITSDTLGRVIRTIPGLGQAADALGGLVEGIVREQISSVGTAVNQAIARPTRATVVDSTDPGPNSATIN